MDTTPAIRATGLRKTFRSTDGGRVVAVDGVDLEVARGEIVAFLGPNGAGKTTTVDMLLGLTTPEAGSVEICGLTPRQAIDAGKVSAMLQTGGLLPDLTVRETVRAIAALHGVDERVADVVARADLAGVAGRKVGACSGGEQQRLRFALALLPDPEVIILDEPTAGMDVAARRYFWETMRADAATGRTIVFATHYLAEADDFAERTVLMAQGSVVADGRTEDVRARFGGRTVSFTPPAHATTSDGLDPAWLDAVERALTPLGVASVDVSCASLEAAFLALTTTVAAEPVAESFAQGAHR